MKRTLEERLRARLAFASAGCLEWAGGRDRDGYGRIWSAGLTLKTHRVAWALENGPIPPGMHVLHKCDNPPCCSAAHLFIGTHSDNVADKMAKGRFRGGPGAPPPRKLSAADEATIRERSLAGESQRALGREFNVSHKTVSSIVRRHSQGR